MRLRGRAGCSRRTGGSSCFLQPGESGAVCTGRRETTRAPPPTMLGETRAEEKAVCHPGGKCQVSWVSAPHHLLGGVPKTDWAVSDPAPGLTQRQESLLAQAEDVGNYGGTMSPMGKVGPFGAAWDWVLLSPLGASPGSGPHALWVSLLQESRGRERKSLPSTGRKEEKSCVSVAPGSGSQSLRVTQGSGGPAAQRGLCRQLGKGTLGSDPLPTADSTGTPSPPPCPHPTQVPRRPWPRAPMQPHPMTPVRRLEPSTAPDAPTEAAETYGVRGSLARGCALAGARQPRRLTGALGPGSFPRAGRTLVSRSAKPHPESSPASRRGGASAGLLCPMAASAWRTGQAAGFRAAAASPPDWASHDGSSCLPPPPSLPWQPRPPGRIRPLCGLSPGPSTPKLLFKPAALVAPG